MVCDKCEKKLKKAGASSATADPLAYKMHNIGSSQTQEKDRIKGGNKLLERRADRFDDSRNGKKNGKMYFRKCRICDATVQQKHFRFCQKCSYIKHICAICGTRVLDNHKMYRQNWR